MAQVISSTTTQEFWRSLEKYFSSTSRARLTELKRQIQTANKDGLSCSEYLLQLRLIADELSFIGVPLPEDELISATINGLGTEYNSIAAVVSTARCYSTFSFSDLRGLLLSHEALLKSHLSSQSTTFYVGKNNAYRARQGNNPNLIYHSRPAINSTKPSDSVLGPFPASAVHSDPKPTCQICNKFDHSARLCFRRYDKDSDQKSFSKSKAYNVQATSSTYDSTNWIIDSGANNHVTNDLNNLTSFYAYNGPDKVQIGIDIGLSITHVVSTSLTMCFMCQFFSLIF
jgi:gag-polypeptide of LTR copia-type